ncbi:hypothetical protein B0H14DRAFT_3437126 [Mycena olivaceomarginata]|nr:hypothetical protein B0H14DRAFT_3437126 [Mycena olivaceomarginata]
MPPPGRSHCCPPFIPEPGHEDVLAFCSKGGRLYVVTNGTRNGVYTSEARARKTVNNVSNGRWRMAKTWEKALNVWNEACDVYHEERCPSHLEEPILSHTGPLFPAPTGPLGDHQDLRCRGPAIIASIFHRCYNTCAILLSCHHWSRVCTPLSLICFEIGNSSPDANAPQACAHDHCAAEPSSDHWPHVCTPLFLICFEMERLA